MANLSKTTRDHEEIQRWAEERGGKPAHVKRTGSKEDIGILRIDFPGFSGEGSLEPITWDQFFEKFDDRNLSLVYQEETAGGERSNFNKLISGGGTTTRTKKKGSKSNTKKAGKNSRNVAAGKKSASKKKAPVKKAVKKTVAKKASSKKAAAKKKTTAKKSAARKRR